MTEERLDPIYSSTRRVMRENPAIISESGAKFDSGLYLPPNPLRKGEGGLRSSGKFKVGENSASNLKGANRPLITVITVVFNRANDLEKAILSVLNQTYDNIEYIVIDGGSSDGTLDVIREYEQAIDYWVSEPDGGIYAAMNKGVTVASGDYVCFLNADDYFSGETVLSELSSEIVKDIQLQALYYGDVMYVNGKVFTSCMSTKSLIINTIHHQGAFYSRSLFTSFRYDERLAVGADYELNLIIYLKKLPSRKIRGVVAICGDVGVSKTIPQMKINLENHFVRRKYMGQLPSMVGFMLSTLNMWRRHVWAKRD